MIAISGHSTGKRHAQAMKAIRWIAFMAAAMIPLSGLGAAPSDGMRTIEILSGTYGTHCGGKTANATHDLAHQCNGLQTCRFALGEMDVHAASEQCERDFVAEWKCNESEFHTASVSPGGTQGSTLVLTCVEPVGPGH